MAIEPATISVPEFLVGKVLLAHLGSSTAVVADVRFEAVAGRLFAMGVSPWGSSPEVRNKRLAIAWDQVEQFFIFDSVEEWRSASKVWASEKEKNKDSPKKPWFSMG